MGKKWEELNFSNSFYSSSTKFSVILEDTDVTGVVEVVDISELVGCKVSVFYGKFFRVSVDTISDFYNWDPLFSYSWNN